MAAYRIMRKSELKRQQVSENQLKFRDTKANAD